MFCEGNRITGDSLHTAAIAAVVEFARTWNRSRNAARLPRPSEPKLLPSSGLGVKAKSTYPRRLQDHNSHGSKERGHAGTSPTGGDNETKSLRRDQRVHVHAHITHLIGTALNCVATIRVRYMGVESLSVTSEITCDHHLHDYCKLSFRSLKELMETVTAIIGGRDEEVTGGSKPNRLGFTLEIVKDNQCVKLTAREGKENHSCETHRVGLHEEGKCDVISRIRVVNLAPRGAGMFGEEPDTGLPNSVLGPEDSWGLEGKVIESNQGSLSPRPEPLSRDPTPDAQLCMRVRFRGPLSMAPFESRFVGVGRQSVCWTLLVLGDDKNGRTKDCEKSRNSMAPPEGGSEKGFSPNMDLCSPAAPVNLGDGLHVYNARFCKSLILYKTSLGLYVDIFDHTGCAADHGTCPVFGSKVHKVIALREEWLDRSTAQMYVVLLSNA